MDINIKPLAAFQQTVLFPEEEGMSKVITNGTANKLSLNDKRFHDWYRFILSFPPHLVRKYLEKFGLRDGDTILDPFCGTGTTVLEAKLCGINAIGIEANPIAHFASSVKVDWEINPVDLINHANKIAKQVTDQLSLEYD